MKLRIPPYRVDVRREADVIEEILRIYGFNRVVTGSGLRSNLSYTSRPDKEQIINLTSEMLTANGFYEMKSNSLTRSAYYDREGDPDPTAVRLHNPLSQDLALMRKNLLYGGLEAIAYNINRKHADLLLYEFGNCYFQRPVQGNGELLDPYDEELHLGMFITGRHRTGNWVQQAEATSFFILKTFVERVLVRVGIDLNNLETGSGSNPDYSDYQVYTLHQQPLVEFGVVADHLLTRSEIKQPVYAAEFHWDRVMAELKERKILFSPLSRFHVVTRDFSMILEKHVTFDALRKLAFSTEKKYLKEVVLFDVYEGEKIEKGKKSYALSFTLLDEEKTLTDKQIERVMLSLARAFEKEYHAVIRGLN